MCEDRRMFKKVCNSKELNDLISSLRSRFPDTQHMWQLLKEVQNGKIEANIYTDEWPNYNSVVSQEFAPRLSEVADIRIYTRKSETVVPILKDAKLLIDVGTWQMIHFMLGTEVCKKLSSELLLFLRHYSSTKDKTSAIIFDNGAYRPSTSVQYKLPPIIPLLPPGLQMKKIPVECADYAGRHWIAPANMEYPLEHRTWFIREVIKRYEMIGAYTADNPHYPVAFAGLKPGGVIGLSYTREDYRHRKKNISLTLTIAKHMVERGDKIFGETNEENIETKRDGYEYSIGRSQILAIY